METGDILRIASQTRAIVDAESLLLQEEGFLLMDDPVGYCMAGRMETTIAVEDDAGGHDFVARAARSRTF